MEQRQPTSGGRSGSFSQPVVAGQLAPAQEGPAWLLIRSQHFDCCVFEATSANGKRLLVYSSCGAGSAVYLRSSLDYHHLSNYSLSKLEAKLDAVSSAGKFSSAFCLLSDHTSQTPVIFDILGRCTGCSVQPPDSLAFPGLWIWVETLDSFVCTYYAAVTTYAKPRYWSATTLFESSSAFANRNACPLRPSGFRVD